MMYNKHRLVKELIRDEGVRYHAYKDSLGYWTIGVGHLLGSEKRMTEIRDDEMMALLYSDIEQAIGVLDRVAFWWIELDPVRQRVLINMAFNLGDKLAQFKNTLAAIRARNWEKAADGMLDSLWARQVKGRATRLADMMRNGKDPFDA